MRYCSLPFAHQNILPKECSSWTLRSNLVAACLSHCLQIILQNEVATGTGQDFVKTLLLKDMPDLMRKNTENYGIPGNKYVSIVM